MKTCLFFLLTFFYTTTLLSQPCSVSVNALKGNYIGECKNGKAEGTGTAVGTDTYAGSFKNGYPEGEGKYTWKNGNWYSGSWKNGVFEGKGTLSKADETKVDSIIQITGFWKKGKYIGLYEKPYTVTAITNNVNDLNTRKLSSAKSDITIIVKSITAGGSSLGTPVLPKPKLTAIQDIQGRFNQQVTDENYSTTGNKYIFRGVKFPYHAIFSFETIGGSNNSHAEKIEVEIMESGDWLIQLNLDN